MCEVSLLILHVQQQRGFIETECVCLTGLPANENLVLDLIQLQTEQGRLSLPWNKKLIISSTTFISVHMNFIIVLMVQKVCR